MAVTGLASRDWSCTASSLFQVGGFRWQPTGTGIAGCRSTRGNIKPHLNKRGKNAYKPPPRKAPWKDGSAHVKRVPTALPTWSELPALCPGSPDDENLQHDGVSSCSESLGAWFLWNAAGRAGKDLDRDAGTVDQCVISGYWRNHTKFNCVYAIWAAKTTIMSYKPNRPVTIMRVRPRLENPDARPMVSDQYSMIMIK